MFFDKCTDTQKEINDFYKNYHNQENNQNEVERIFVKPRKVKPADILLVALILITLIILLFAIIYALTTFKIIVYDVMILPVGLILVFGNSFTITKLINERLTKRRCTYRLRGLVTDVKEETGNNNSTTSQHIIRFRLYTTLIVRNI